MFVVEVVGGIIAHVGAEAAQSKGRSWLDKRDLEKLGDDAKQAFIAGLVFVASYDGTLSTAELEEVEDRLRRLDIEQDGRQATLAMAAREEVAAAIGGDEEAYLRRLVARLPEDGRVRDALLRVSIAVAMKGDLARQLVAVRLLGKVTGMAEETLEAMITEETRRLVR